MKKTSFLFQGIALVFLSAFMFIISSCCKNNIPDCQPYGVAKPPKTLCFEIKHKNILLPDSIINALKLFYKNNDQQIYVTDFQRIMGTNYPYGIMATRDVGLLSADKHVKDYYLEFPNGDIDTLFVDYNHYNPCEADTSSCYCIYPLLNVKYNGQPAPIDNVTSQTTQIYPLYLFNK